MKPLVTVFLLVILFSGCENNQKKKNDYEELNQVNQSVSENSKNKNSDGKKPVKVTFETEHHFGSTEEVVIGKIATFAIDDLDRVFIADMNQSTVHVFSSDGNYKKSIGRQGNGPGEFSTVSPVTKIGIYLNKLYVFESRTYSPRSAQVFLLENLTFSHTLELLAENKADFKLKGYFPTIFFPLSDGEFLVAYRSHPTVEGYTADKDSVKYFIQDSTGRIISDGAILEQKGYTHLVHKYPNGSRKIHSFPFFGKPLLAVSDDDLLYAARSEEFEIEVYNQKGELINTIQHKFNNKVFHKSKVIDRYKKTDYMTILDNYDGEDVVLKMIEAADNLPEYWPALERMFFDDKDRLWVSTIIDNNEVYEWWILEKTGEVITKFKWPRDKPIEEVKNGYMYTRETGDKGVENIIKYKIQIEKE